jgi:hypothetical protein
LLEEKGRKKKGRGVSWIKSGRVGRKKATKGPLTGVWFFSSRFPCSGFDDLARKVTTACYSLAKSPAGLAFFLPFCSLTPEENDTTGSDIVYQNMSYRQIVGDSGWVPSPPFIDLSSYLYVEAINFFQGQSILNLLHRHWFSDMSSLALDTASHQPPKLMKSGWMPVQRRMWDCHRQGAPAASCWVLPEEVFTRS